MRDRLPELGKANRIRITMDDGQTIEGVLSYADNASQDGSVYSKGNVLPDAVCVALGLNTDTAEPKDAFEMLAALAVSGGGSGDVGELEDTAFEVGTITNAGAGWNTFKFREAFDAAPQVVCQAEDFDGIVQVKSVTADGFLYCLRTLSTGSYYTGGPSGSTPSHSANTLVNGSTTTATAVKIRYMAIEYGGER